MLIYFFFFRCKPGYGGSRCQTCISNFYGNPLDAGGSCKKCECSGNINPLYKGSNNNIQFIGLPILTLYFKELLPQL